MVYVGHVSLAGITEAVSHETTSYLRSETVMLENVLTVMSDIIIHSRI